MKSPQSIEKVSSGKVIRKQKSSPHNKGGGGGATTFSVGAAVKKMTKDKRLYRRLDYDLACPEHL